MNMTAPIGRLSTRPPHSTTDYYKRLEGSLNEKLFFLSKLPSDATVIADFGCGDGALLRACKMEGFDTIGYDRSEDAIKLACGWDPSALWTPKLETFKAHISAHQKRGHKVCLVLSSVVHEVLSEDGVTWENFWSTIYGLGCDYIAIRDMACRTLDTLPMQVELDGTVYKNRADALQFLLKYRYTEDKDKEEAENYFPLTIEQWETRLGVSGYYAIDPLRHYLPEFHRRQWLMDFGLVLINSKTHFTVLLKRLPDGTD